MADVNDLWPEAMRMVIDIPLISDVLFHGLAKDAREVYRRLSAAVGTSDDYSSRPFTDCKQSIERITVYVGNDLDAFDEGARSNAETVVKPDGEFWVTYAGTIGKSYDIATLVRASAELRSRGMHDVRMMVLGDGPDLSRVRKLSARLNCNVEFVGYQNYPMMAAYLVKSDITINSLVKKAPQSVVTKIGDYLAAGCPMINTGSNKEFCDKMTADGFGLSVEAENPRALADAIATLHDDPKRRAKMGECARKMAESQFDRKISYRRISDLVEKLVEENRSRQARTS